MSRKKKEDMNGLESLSDEGLSEKWGRIWYRLIELKSDRTWNMSKDAEKTNFEEIENLSDLLDRIKTEQNRRSGASSDGNSSGSWIDKARDLGVEIKKQNPEKNHKQIATEIHKKFKDKDITGRGKRTPAVTTIMREALKGI